MTRRADRIADARLAVFVAGLAVGAAAWWGYVPWLALLLPGAGFVALMVLHEQTHRARDLARLGVTLYSELSARAGVGGTPPACGFEPMLAVPSPHLYASDFDLFGRGGLFELLCRARTLVGAKTLAGWLLAPALPEVVVARQTAVKELIDLHDLREALALTAGAVQAAVSEDDLRRWSGEPARLGVGWRLPVACVLAALAVLALPAVLFGFAGAPVLVLSANILFLFSCRGGIIALDNSLSPIGRELKTLSAVLALLERAPFSAPLLREQQAQLLTGTESASQAIRRLESLALGFDVYRNQLFAVIAIYTLWPFWWGWAIEGWRARHRDALHHQWMQALGQLEALCSIAGYASERDEDAWPEFVEGDARYEANALGHPLLPVGARVRNDVALGPQLPLLMVSGSNMSGKSTLLRAIGLSVALAHAGGPVCARRAVLTPLQIGAVIRVEDSIQRGASRFYAEIERFKAVLDVSEGKLPVLFLCDEILHGTNTRDRVEGAKALIRALMLRGGIGLVTTHDLALTEFVAEIPNANNVHFQDDIVEGRLAFDYRLREGVVTKSNALDLMRAIGLPVEP
jgi:hypothetical protein